MAEVVPEYNNFFEVYGTYEGVRDRYVSLVAAFTGLYGSAPDLFARAPGRVNLIGEHIDYEGYAVLPMAIRQDTVVAIRKGGTKLSIASITPDQYANMEFDTDPGQEVDIMNHTWANYFLAAYKGVFDHLAATGRPVPEPVGLQVMVHGVVPQGSGLSSSSAIVCSSALAVLGALGVSLTKAEVAEFSCKAERYVGVTSGGMDQAISMMAAPGVAKLVEFNPVRASDVALPASAIFVVAHSLAVSNKAETAPYCYNMRVVECRLAAAVAALALGCSRTVATTVMTLSQLERVVEEKRGSSALTAAGGAEEVVKEVLRPGRYTQPEIEELLGAPLSDLLAGSPMLPAVLTAAVSSGGFALRDRAIHVFSEAARVRRFKAVCDEDESTSKMDDKLAQLGDMMNASHASCAELYQCSCAELDALVTVARQAGALGARLTGAGWGGCTVSLVREEDVHGFIDTLKEKYFAPLIQAGVIREEELGDYLFATKPSSGAALLRITLP